MNRRLDGKVALVTGGGSGIGAAIVERFAASGAAVVLTGRRPGPIAQMAQKVDGLAIPADVRDRAAMAAVVEKALDRYGGLDIVVANAGVIKEGDVASMTDGDWQMTMDINLTGVMHTARAALPALKERDQGAIIIVSSVAGLMGVPSGAAYCTSKTALVGLTRSMAFDYGPMGIRVNTLCPGWVKTPMSDEEMAALAKEKGISREAAVEAVTQYLPLRRMAAPEEIAACAEFLASGDASFVTGTVLVADGGGCIVDVGTLAFAFD